MSTPRPVSSESVRQLQALINCWKLPTLFQFRHSETSLRLLCYVSLKETFLFIFQNFLCMPICILLTIKRGREICVHFMTSLESIIQIWYTYHSYPSVYSEIIQMKISVFTAKLCGNKKTKPNQNKANLISYEK